MLPHVKALAEKVDPFPCLDPLWNIYSKKGIKTIFLSIGASKSCLADLEIAEILGCPIHVATINAEQEEKWKEVKDCLVSRERVAAKFDFSDGSEEKWITAKNFRMVGAPPLWGSGPRDSEPLFDWMKGLCYSMNVSETRIDILKIDVGNGDERAILMAALDAGFRPSCIMVNWSHMPDTDVPSSLTAGHLQNTGYQLIGMHETKFLYYFIDKDWYMTCSWEETSCPNPMVREIIKMVPRIREANDCSKRLAAAGKTDPPPESEKAESESAGVQ